MAKFLVIGDGVADIWYLNGGAPLTRIVTAGGAGLCASFLNEFGETYLITAIEQNFIEDLKYLPLHHMIVPDIAGEIRVRFMTKDQTLLTSRQHRKQIHHTIPEISFDPDLVLVVDHGYQTFSPLGLGRFVNKFSCPKILATRVEPNPEIKDVLYYVCNESEFDQWGECFLASNPGMLIKTNCNTVTLYTKDREVKFPTNNIKTPQEFTVGAGDLFVSQLSRLIVSKETEAVKKAAEITADMISDRPSFRYGWMTSWQQMSFGESK